MNRLKILFVLLGMCLAIPNVFAQKIKTDEVDKFTKSRIVETSMEELCSKKIFTTQYRLKLKLRKAGENYMFFAEIASPEIEKYDETSGAVLLLENGETVNLITNIVGVGSRRYNFYYLFDTSFNVNQEDIEKLKKNKVTDVRLLIFDTKIDIEVKDKKQDLIQKMLGLIDERLNK